MKTYLYLVCLALEASHRVLALQHRASNWTVGQIVKTSSGPVTGHPASVSQDVSEYLGIPYAVPPVGDLRWTAPQAYNGSSPVNGTNFVCKYPFIFLKTI